MKRTYLSLFMAVVLLVSLVPAGALGAVGCIQCRPGDVIYAVFVLAEDGDRADGVMGRLSYPLEIFSVLPYADLHGLDGFYILNRRPAVIAFQVNQYAPAGEYTIEAIMVEAADADGTKYENVRIEPVRVVVESVFSREEAMAERARLEQKLTEAEAARTELQDKVETLTVEKNETEYRLAEALYSAGDYEGAKTIFDALAGYREAAEQVKACEEAIEKRNDRYAVGKYVTFGRYPQTAAGNDHTPIEWLVLARDGNKALLLSRYGLDAKPYNAENVDITWEMCTLRVWLNQEFLKKAFSSTEQNAILTTNVDNSRIQGYSEWDTKGGNNTQDKVFLLSYAEANKYLDVKHWEVTGAGQNMTSRASPTAYALKQGAFTSNDCLTADGSAAWWWWLRSPGDLQKHSAGVGSGGSLYNCIIYYDYGCVRPALWIDLDSEIFEP